MSEYEFKKLLGIGKYGSPESRKKLEEMMKADRGEWSVWRTAAMLEMVDKKGNIRADIPKKDLSAFSHTRYQYFLSAPFEIGSGCCAIMKKGPMKAYEKKAGTKPMTAQMAAESRLRTQNWLKHGCNAFDAKRPTSNPMSFWLEQDVLLYIYQNQIPICSVYGDIVKETEIEGQMDFEDLGVFDLGRPLLKTTGCQRTGCMFCGFGCHLEKPGEGRFERMKITHPKQYEWIMKPWGEGGLGYKDVIDWINENGELDIRY